MSIDRKILINTRTNEILIESILDEKMREKLDQSMKDLIKTMQDNQNFRDMMIMALTALSVEAEMKDCDSIKDATIRFLIALQAYNLISINYNYKKI